MATDFQETVLAASRGDRAAFDSLFARNLPALMAFLRAKAGGVVAEKESISDLAQSVCREVLVDMEDFEYQGDEGFRKWLFLQAARKINDRHRYHRRERRDVAREVSARPSMSDDEAGSLLDCYATLGTPSRHMAGREQLERFEQALEKLPESQREAVVMARIMQIPYPDIAEHLQCTEGAARALVSRGLARVAVALRRG